MTSCLLNTFPCRVGVGGRRGTKGSGRDKETGGGRCRSLIEKKNRVRYVQEGVGLEVPKVEDGIRK